MINQRSKKQASNVSSSGSAVSNRQAGASNNKKNEINKDLKGINSSLRLETVKEVKKQASNLTEKQHAILEKIRQMRERKRRGEQGDSSDEEGGRRALQSERAKKDSHNLSSLSNKSSVLLPSISTEEIVSASRKSTFRQKAPQFQANKKKENVQDKKAESAVRKNVPHKSDSSIPRNIKISDLMADVPKDIDKKTWARILIDRGKAFLDGTLEEQKRKEQGFDERLQKEQPSRTISSKSTSDSNRSRSEVEGSKGGMGIGNKKGILTRSQAKCLEQENVPQSACEHDAQKRTLNQNKPIRAKRKGSIEIDPTAKRQKVSQSDLQEALQEIPPAEIIWPPELQQRGNLLPAFQSSKQSSKRSTSLLINNNIGTNTTRTSQSGGTGGDGSGSDGEGSGGETEVGNRRGVMTRAHAKRSQGTDVSIISFSKETQRLLGQTDRLYREQLFERRGKNKDQTTLRAAQIELDGKQISFAVERGRNFDHVEKVRNAQNGLYKHIKTIKNRLSFPDLICLAERDALQEELSKASRLLDYTEEFVPRTKERKTRKSLSQI